MLAAGLALCTCGGLAIPDSGSTDVPVDVNPLVQGSSYAESDVRLEDAEGGIVEADITFHDQDGTTWLSVAPVGELAPVTEHVLRYYVDGSPDYYNPFYRFTTGDAAAEPDLQPPAIEGIFAGIQPFHGDCVSSCYSGNSRTLVRIEQEPEPDVAYYEVTLRSGDAEVMRFLPSKRSSLSNGSCGIKPPDLSAGAELCLQMRAVALDGTRSEPSAETCTEVVACASIDPCEPDGFDECFESAGADAGVEPVDPPDDRGGCSASRSSAVGWLILMLLFHWYRRRRA